MHILFALQVILNNINLDLSRPMVHKFKVIPTNMMRINNNQIMSANAQLITFTQYDGKLFLPSK